MTMFIISTNLNEVLSINIAQRAREHPLATEAVDPAIVRNLSSRPIESP
jgi:hypothetical protein